MAKHYNGKVSADTERKAWTRVVLGGFCAGVTRALADWVLHCLVSG